MFVRSKRRALALGVALLLPTAVVLTAPTANATPGRVAIRATMPRWLARTTAKARTTDVAPAARADQRLSVRVYLAPKGGQAALEKKVAALSDPVSPDYGTFLTAAQYGAAYGPTEATADGVRRYLTAQGLTVTGTEAQRRYVAVSGTVSELDRAFAVSLRRLSHDGQEVVAPTTAASLPAAVAASVLTVSGLDTTVARMTPRRSPRVTPPPGFVNARPCSTYFGQLTATYEGDYRTKLPTFEGKTLPYAPCGYTGTQLRSAYAGGRVGGAGVTVAITDAYRWQLIAKDANRYATEHGDGAYEPGQLSENLPASYHSQKECDAPGWSGEETLDVEAVHAMAPGASIRYYASASCNDDDFVDTLGRVVDEDVADVVTNSWGDAGEAVPVDEIVAYQQVILQGAAQGMSFLFSSGDDGDELASTGFKQADFPASLPSVTAVGGTSTGIGANGVRLFDAGWGTRKYSLADDGGSWTSNGFLYGAGGGYSTLFDRPTYQNGIVPASAPPGRAVPDLAMDADPSTGMLVGQTQTFPDSVHYGESRIGGTSLASPLLAGMTALAIQQNHGQSFGELNPLVYKAGGIAFDVKKRPAYPGVVRADYANSVDPAGGVLYSVRTFGQDSSLEVVEGWDPVTGIGAPNIGFLKLGQLAAHPAVAAVR